MLAFRRSPLVTPSLPMLLALPNAEKDFAPELHRQTLRTTMTLVDGDPESKKNADKGDAKQKKGD